VLQPQSKWLIASFCPEQHIDFVSRLELVPQLLILPYLNHQPSALGRSTWQVRSDIRDHVRQEASNLNKLRSKPLPELTKHLRDVYEIGVLRYVSDPAATGHGQESLKQRITQVGHIINEVDCLRCKKRTKHICDYQSRERDAKAVANKGECWQAFQEIFDAALYGTEKYYRKFSEKKCKEARKINVIFTTILKDKSAKFDEHTGEDRRDSVAAYTDIEDREMDDGKVHYQSCTEFFVPVKNFSEQTYYELPYKVFHEVAVHAVQASATRSSSEPRSIYGSDCAMAEGLVDALAVDILRRTLDDQENSLDDQENSGGMLILLRKDIDNATSQMMWNRRRAYMQSVGSAGFLEARSCAYDIYDEMKKLYGDETTAGIVMGFNLSGLTKDQREFILSSTGEIIFNHGVWNEIDRDFLSDSLKEFLIEGNTDKLLSELREICQ